MDGTGAAVGEGQVLVRTFLLCHWIINMKWVFGLLLSNLVALQHFIVLVNVGLGVPFPLLEVEVE